MKIKSILSTLPALAVPAILLVLGGCKPSGSVPDVSKAFPEQADVAIYVNQAALSDSAFSRAMEDMEDDVEDMEGAGMASEFSDRISEVTGLDDDDIEEVVFTLSNVDAFSTDPTAVKISGAVSVSKSVTAEEIAEAIELAASENGEEVELTVVPGEGADYIEFPQEEDMPELVAAVVTGGSASVAFFGDRPSVDAAMARDAGGPPASLTGPSAGLIEGEQGWVSFILTEQLKAQLAGMSAQAQQMAPGLEKIQSLESAGVAMKSGDALEISIGLTLGSEADARAIAKVLNNQLISFAKMMVAGNTPEPLPVLETLTATSDGMRSILSLKISVADLEIIQEQLAGMMTPAMGQ